MSSRKEERERLRAERLAAGQAASATARRRQLAGYVVAGLLAVPVIVGLVVVIAQDVDDGGTGSACATAHVQTSTGDFSVAADCRTGTTPPDIQFGDLRESAQRAGCDLRLNLPDEGSNHFSDLARFDRPGAYGTVPPTSGNHYGSDSETAAGAMADGAYRERPPIGRVVHSMEHSRMNLHYDPDLSEEQELALKGVFDEDPGGILMFPDSQAPYAPDEKTDYAVAATAWTNEVICPTYNPLVLDVVRNFRDTYRGNGPEQVPIDASD